MQQIATQLGCSIHKVAYWMEQYGLVRRGWSEATYIYRNPDGDPFAIKMPETPEEWKLFGVGIGLYMGEGAKTGFNVSLSNSDPGIHRTFINFLKKLCGVDKAALRADLNIYDDCDVDEALQWWSNQIGLNPEQFATPYIRKAYKAGSYSNKARFGTLGDCQV